MAKSQKSKKGSALLQAVPPSIKIGAHLYNVLKQPLPEHESAWAQTNNQKYSITIDPEANNDIRLAHSILHETLHGIWHDRFLWTDKAAAELEEAIIQQVCGGMIAVFLDNPWMLPWLIRALRK